MINNIIKLFLFVAACGQFSVAFLYLVPKYRELNEIKLRGQKIEQNADGAKLRVWHMEKKIEDLKYKPSAIAHVAREKYLMCREGERIYQFVDEKDHPFESGDVIE